MKRIGLLALALVLALGTLGVGYAHWSDDAEIVQIVETGSLELGVRGEAWLTGDDKDMVTLCVMHDGFKFFKDPYDYFQTVTVTVGNLYPSVWVMENFYIALGGTVPVHLSLGVTYNDPDGVYACMTIAWTVFFPGGATLSGVGIPDLILALEGFQLHPCETITIYLDKHLEQCAPQGKTASFTLTVTGTQYNF